MNYIIFDLEWNQPPVEEAAVLEPVYLTGEIIEIGAVKLNEGFQVADELRLYIAPQYYTKMHRRIASLTGIHDRDLKARGVPFPQAFDTFRDWCGEEYAYMTWSLSDLPMLVENMQLHGIDTSELPVCYDIQRIFGREIMRSSRRYALDHAIELLKEQGDVAHDALHDARNTAKICDHLDLEEYIGEYAARAFADAPCTRRFDSVSEILSEEALSSFVCPWCGEKAMGEGWLPYSSGHYMTMAVCPQGDEFLILLECTGSRQNGCHARRLMYEMSDDLWELYQDARELAKA